MDAIKNLLGNRMVRGAIQNVAPKVVGALAGPAGPLAEGVVRRVAGELLGDPEAPREAVVKRLAEARQEDMAKLAQIEADLEAEQERIAAADRVDARAREIKTGDRFPMFFAIGVGTAFFSYLTLLVFQAPPDGSASIVFGGAGTLGTAFIASVTYYFGSSRGSKIKDEMIARAGR